MITLIANPSSRSGAGKLLWEPWLTTLQDQSLPHDLLESASRADCETTAGLACRDSSAVVAMGGDGTINAVINGMMRARALEECALPPLGVLYAGTSPDFCRFHGIPSEAGPAMDLLLAGGQRQVDVASIAFTGPEGEAVRGYFACGCHIGLGSATAAFANTWRKTLGDRCGTGLGLVQAMLRHKPFACRLFLDGEAMDFERANHIMILKNPHIASGLRVNLPLEPDDGSLIVLVLHNYSRPGLLRLLPMLYSGALTQKSGVFMRRCRSVQVEANPVQPVEFDGDPQGTGAVSVRVLPRALPLICAGANSL